MKPDNTGDYVGMSAAEANAESENADTPENREAWNKRMDSHRIEPSTVCEKCHCLIIKGQCWCSPELAALLPTLERMKTDEDAADAEEDGEHPEDCECWFCEDERAEDQKMRDADRANDEAIDDDMTERLR